MDGDFVSQINLLINPPVAWDVPTDLGNQRLGTPEFSLKTEQVNQEINPLGLGLTMYVGIAYTFLWSSYQQSSKVGGSNWKSTIKQPKAWLPRISSRG